ncbi:MAG: spermidine synthase [Saprospiraceae bacterium]|jgi:spermidine synthase
MLSKKTQFLLICVLFVLSGVAALIYQITWFKHLSYFLGNSTYAQAVVLATFMGGLAIGSWWWGKKSDESKNPLMLFAWLEILIGLYCFFYMPIFEGIKHLFISIVVANEWASDSGIVLLLKVFASSFAIIIPTILMGGTLPVLVKCLSERIEEVGKNVAVLYFINSLGAVIGSVLAGFYFLDRFGLTITTYLGATMDFVVGIVFLVIALKLNHNSDEKPIKQQARKNQDVFSISKRQHQIVLLIAGVSGLCAMMYEVAWLRLLIPILSSTTYSFTIILTAFITGITLGSLLVYYLLPKIKNAYLFLGLCQAGIVISILLSLPFYEKLPYYIWHAVGINNEIGGYGNYLKVQFLYVFLLMVVPTIFMGMSLPVASKLVVTDVNNSGKSVGNVFAINTVGTVIGSLTAGMILIPLVGIKHTVDIAIVLNCALACIVIFGKLGLKLFGRIIFVCLLASSLGYYIGHVKQERWANSIMLSEIPRKINRKKAPRNFRKFLEKTERDKTELLYYKEGISGTIVVGKKSGEVFLFTNGKGDANSVGDLQTQSSLGHTPILLHPSPDTVLVIGFGAGHTIGSVMTHPDIKFAQVAEISPEVIDASVHFEHVNERPLDDERLQLIKDDGVSALRLSPYKYDVIISQPSNPWSAGVGNLFTKEFFKDCKSKLRPGGYVAQWFSLYEMDDKSLKLIMRTVLDQFEYVSVWGIGTSDILLICSETPFHFDLPKMEERYKKVQKHLGKENVSIRTFSAFLSQQYLASTDALRTYADKGELNTEDHPLLELWTPKAYFFDHEPVEFLNYDAWRNYSQSNLLLKQYLQKSNGISTYDKIEIALLKSNGGDDGNKKFTKYYDIVSGSQTTIYPTKTKGQPEKLFVGWLDLDDKIHPLDTIHPNQKVSTWSCCGSYKVNKKLKYVWTTPQNRELSHVNTYDKGWITSWVSHPDNDKPLAEGNWSVKVYDDNTLILAQSFVVDKSAPILKPKHPHNKIIVAAKDGNNLTPLTEVHPMQHLYLSTSGIAYGKNELVNVFWTSPSNKVSKDNFSYESHYQICWVPKSGKLPMEKGNWKVRIESFTGVVYLETEFIVNEEAKLMNQ